MGMGTQTRQKWEWEWEEYMGMATFHTCQNSHRLTRCEWNPIKFIYLFIYLKCNVTSLFCEQMYVCMLYVDIFRLRQLSVCILNIIIV